MIIPCNADIDDCGVCFGNNEDLDCNGDCFGTAFEDDCDVCSVGNTGHVANSDIDCYGDCFGEAFEDDERRGRARREEHRAHA